MIVAGKIIAGKVLDRLKEKITALPKTPVLGVVLVGDNQSSVIYINKKRQSCENIGIGFKLFSYPNETTEENLLTEIERIQDKEELSALIVQLPLPDGFDTKKILDAVRPEFDVDCLSSVNIARLRTDNPVFIPPTPGAILEILNYYNIELSGCKIAVVGLGQLVGSPILAILKQRGYDVTACDIDTSNRNEIIKNADVLITGVGKPKIITAEMVKNGVVIMDAGISFVDGKTVGDVDFEGIKEKASLVTPPTGGVGPVTVAKLLENVVKNQ
ncbi:MAG: bifunctional 5,10-methylenetetrahydrofolate dehydrogenase/5,10-methenyltetrahydrofolate cyclohydrolase [Patescibacteria group bacterium]|jgi:methylenetetrahydrofolate dehydrogenase (NADP+)/methenyltetrahydrofolate cyclohydrolase